MIWRRAHNQAWALGASYLPDHTPDLRTAADRICFFSDEPDPAVSTRLVAPFRRPA